MSGAGEWLVVVVVLLDAVFALHTQAIEGIGRLLLEPQAVQIVYQALYENSSTECDNMNK